MIDTMQLEHIEDIAYAQIAAWRVAFRGILSDEVLSSLSHEDFINNWKEILKQESRSNLVYMSEEGRAVGFISFGKPKDNRDPADYEIYGIYVDPEYWGRMVGQQLMKAAIHNISSFDKESSIILWTMAENSLSKRFYSRYGFLELDIFRTSQRSGDYFEEVKYIYHLHY